MHRSSVTFTLSTVCRQQKPPRVRVQLHSIAHYSTVCAQCGPPFTWSSKADSRATASAATLLERYCIPLSTNETSCPMVSSRSLFVSSGHRSCHSLIMVCARVVNHVYQGQGQGYIRIYKGWVVRWVSWVGQPRSRYNCSDLYNSRHTECIYN